MRLRPAVLAISVLFASLALAPAAAQATTGPAVTIDPAAVAIGETTTVTATGLGGLETATFGMDATDAAAFDGDGVDAGGTTARVAVVDGSATVELIPTRAGEIVVAVGTGESTLAQATVTVTAATAEPVPATSAPSSAPESSASPSAGEDSAQAEPDAEAETGRLAFVLVPLIAAVIVGVGLIVVISRSRRGRRGD
ncbi:hypothetical protein IFU40_15510 [Microbacterium sp. CFBP 13617]|uniref:hypothetical protein n=1 Tax=unclassified Microbacterium TaxID=2609290 RepID=UPI0006FDA7F9|nr:MULTISPECIES: hypothetical protein [unclassified Microbacterium]KQR88902.1 hypothetical protein ASF96_03865 [Microbacterium sp. Leaf179]MBD8220041.1 hypothetical protein [Microbacterium sp. CFBP 13617]